jgi:Cytochrome c oxidase caa3 assembly factor (Caa3_CtaG)
VIKPWPTVSRWPRWSIPLYLFLATLPCDGLSAFLAFCGRVVYPQYAALHAHCGGSPEDGPPRSSGVDEPPTRAFDEVRVGAHQAAAPITALEDQQRAGALMWFWVTFAYLLPAALVTIELLSPRERRVRRTPVLDGPGRVGGELRPRSIEMQHGAIRHAPGALAPSSPSWCEHVDARLGGDEAGGGATVQKPDSPVTVERSGGELNGAGRRCG